MVFKAVAIKCVLYPQSNALPAWCGMSSGAAVLACGPALLLLPCQGSPAGRLPASCESLQAAPPRRTRSHSTANLVSSPGLFWLCSLPRPIACRANRRVEKSYFALIDSIFYHFTFAGRIDGAERRSGQADRCSAVFTRFPLTSSPI